MKSACAWRMLKITGSFHIENGTIHRSIWLRKAQINRCSFCKNHFYYQNLQFVKKTIKKMQFLVIHDFIILTRHCQSFLMHKDDDRIIIRNLISCALACSFLIESSSRTNYTFLKFNPSYMFFQPFYTSILYE